MTFIMNNNSQSINMKTTPAITTIKHSYNKSIAEIKTTKNNNNKLE